MPEDESPEPLEGGLKGRLKSLEGSRPGPESIMRPETTETEGEEEDPKQRAINLLLEAKLSVADIASQVGLSAPVVGGLKSQLLRKGYLTSEKAAGGSPGRIEGKPDPLEEMRSEMSEVLQEELMSVPGASEKASAYILKRFASDEQLIFDAYKLHALIARFNPRLSDADVIDVVQRVQRISEAYHLDRLKGMEAFQGYRGGLPRSQGRPNYDVRAGLIPGYGQQEPSRTYTESDIQNERRVWNLERRQDELNNFLEKTNQTLEKILERTDKPSVLAENDSIEKLGGKIEKLESELKLKEREMDQKDKETLRNEIGNLKDEVKSLRNNIGDWKSDEYKIIGNAMDKAVDFGKQVLDKAPLAQAAQQISKAVMPGQQQEVPAEARKTVIELLRSEGLTVPE